MLRAFDAPASADRTVDRTAEIACAVSLSAEDGVDGDGDDDDDDETRSDLLRKIRTGLSVSNGAPEVREGRSSSLISVRCEGKGQMKRARSAASTLEFVSEKEMRVSMSLRRRKGGRRDESTHAFLALSMPMRSICPCPPSMSRSCGEEPRASCPSPETCLNPAVSATTTLYPSMSSVSSSTSLVVPGVGDTIAASRSASAFSKLDFPAFGGPKIANLIPSVTISAAPRLSLPLPAPSLSIPRWAAIRARRSSVAVRTCEKESASTPSSSEKSIDASQ